MADVLFGDVAPRGRLPLTLPKVENEVQFTKAQYPGENGVVQYSEKLEVGYRWYHSHKVCVVHCARVFSQSHPPYPCNCPMTGIRRRWFETGRPPILVTAPALRNCGKSAAIAEHQTSPQSLPSPPRTLPYTRSSSPSLGARLPQCPRPVNNPGDLEVGQSGGSTQPPPPPPGRRPLL